jgi:hypothetical protein
MKESKNDLAIRKLMQNKKDSDPLFTTRTRLTKSIHRTTLTKELNHTRYKLGSKYDKRFPTHSFRLGFATLALANHSLHKVQLALNHKSSLATARYSRRTDALLLEDKKKAIEAVQNAWAN